MHNELINTLERAALSSINQTRTLVHCHNLTALSKIVSDYEFEVRYLEDHGTYLALWCNRYICSKDITHLDNLNHLLREALIHHNTRYSGMFVRCSHGFIVKAMKVGYQSHDDQLIDVFKI